MQALVKHQRCPGTGHLARGTPHGWQDSAVHKEAPRISLAMAIGSRRQRDDPNRIPGKGINFLFK